MSGADALGGASPFMASSQVFLIWASNKLEKRDIRLAWKERKIRRRGESKSLGRGEAQQFPGVVETDLHVDAEWCVDDCAA